MNCVQNQQKSFSISMIESSNLYLDFTFALIKSGSTWNCCLNDHGSENPVSTFAALANRDTPSGGRCGRKIYNSSVVFYAYEDFQISRGICVILYTVQLGVNGGCYLILNRMTWNNTVTSCTAVSSAFRTNRFAFGKRTAKNLVSTIPVRQTV